MNTNEIKELVVAGYKKAEEFLVSGHCEQAKLIAKQILKVDPNCQEAKLVIGMSLANTGNFSEAKEHISKTIKEFPEDFRSYNNYGLVCSMEGNSEEAIKYFKLASEKTTDIGPKINLALEMEDENLLKQISSPVAKFNYAGFLHKNRRLAEAEKIYRELDTPLAKSNLAKICLLTGRLKEGYQLLESRWEAFPHLSYIKQQLKSPMWDGTPGKRLVLFCEQGLGDYIQFARYFDKAKEICQEVYLDVGNSLREAFSNYRSYQGEPVDYCCSVMSLPNILGTEIVTPIKLKSKEISLGKYKGFKIGLCWSGSPSHPDDLSRSIHLKEFEEMSKIENTKWFSCGWCYGNQIKKGKIINWELGAENVTIVDTSSLQKDVSGTAGLINELDLVITVDTATAHIAGSLNKETWLLLPYNGEWRWGTENKTQWYPSIKIFRQHIAGNWSSLLSEVHYNLTQLIYEHYN